MENARIASYLFSLRKKHNKTQKEIAEICHVSMQAVSKWEKGSSLPDIESLQVLSEFYGVSINTILDGGIRTKTEKTIRNNALFIMVILLISFFAFFMPYSTMNIRNLPNCSISSCRGLQILFEGQDSFIILFIGIQVAGILVLFLMHLTLVIAAFLGKIKPSNYLNYSVLLIALIVILIGLYGTIARVFLSTPQILLTAMLLIMLRLYHFPLLKRLFKALKLPEKDASLSFKEIALKDYIVSTLLVLISGFFLAEGGLRLAQLISVIGTSIPFLFFLRELIIIPLIFIGVAIFNLMTLMKGKSQLNEEMLVALGGLNLFITTLFYAILNASDRFVMVGSNFYIITVFVLLSMGVFFKGLIQKIVIK